MKTKDTGPFDAKIMIVGDFPSSNDLKSGLPFSGSSGKLLKNMLQHAGISYPECYVTNVVNEPAHNNRFEHFYEDNKRKTPTQFLQKQWVDLQDKIKRLNPNVVLALGAEPLRALTNKTDLKAWRGSIMLTLGTKVIASYHPRDVMRQYDYHPIFEMDAGKVKRFSLTAEHNEPLVNIKLKPNIEDALNWISIIKRNQSRFSFDLETIGSHIRCISLAFNPCGIPNAIVIPFITFNNSGGFQINKGVLKIQTDSQCASSYWTAENELLILDALNGLFQDENIEKVGHNSMSFDAPIIQNRLKMDIKNHYLDTMHAHHDLYSELPKSLDFITIMYTDFNNYWSDKVTSNDMSEWQYCAMDSISTLVCSYEIEKNLKEAGMFSYYHEIRKPLALALADAQTEGLDIDEVRRTELITEANKKLLSLKNQLKKITKTDTDINPNSHPQIKKLLYETMSFPKVYVKGKVTVDEKALRALERKFPNEPILEAIIMYRKTLKLISTYLKAIVDDDGKMRTSWNPSGTKGSRISSSKTIWKTGLQMQNIPKGITRGVTNIRDIFIAGKTKCLCCD